MKRLLWERDWLWTFEPSRWKSKKSDWLDLEQIPLDFRHSLRA